MNKKGVISPFIISFSGIDGAGKTTQIDSLHQKLESYNTDVRIIRFWDEVATLKRLRETSSSILFGSEQGVGTVDRPVNRRDKNVQSWYMTPVRIFLYLLDSIHLSLVARRAQRSGPDVVIFDRYIYDELANLNFETSRLQRLFAKRILRWIPKPDMAVLLDVDPILARARKPEYPLEFMHRNREAYLELGRMVPGLNIVRGKTVAETSDRIIEIWQNRWIAKQIGSLGYLPSNAAQAPGE